MVIHALHSGSKPFFIDSAVASLLGSSKSAVIAAAVMSDDASSQMTLTVAGLDAGQLVATLQPCDTHKIGQHNQTSV
jgi:prophage antirepressor-like protein